MRLNADRMVYWLMLRAYETLQKEPVDAEKIIKASAALREAMTACDCDLYWSPTHHRWIRRKEGRGEKANTNA